MNMENAIGYDNNRLCVEYGNKHYPIEAVEVYIFLEPAYITERKGVSQMVVTTKLTPDDKVKVNIDKGDVQLTYHVPSARSIGKAYDIQILPGVTREDREELAKLYSYIMKDSVLPVEVLGSVADMKDGKIPLIEVKTRGSYKESDKCDYCDEKAIDSCTLCGKDLCYQHDIICKPNPLIPITLGYCEDCLYLLNLVPLPTGALPHNRKYEDRLK